MHIINGKRMALTDVYNELVKNKCSGIFYLFNKEETPYEIY